MIEISAMFPVYVSDNLNELKTFYEMYFGFQTVFFDENFYLHLLYPKNGIQLGFLLPDLSSQPTFLHPLAIQDGMVISFEVADAGSAYAKALSENLDIAMDYKEENWGQTHFMIRDPKGFIIDIVQHLQ